MAPLLYACVVVITLETQKCQKKAPCSIEFNFFTNCDRQKRFSQNETRRADLQNLASDFLIFALGLSYDLSKFSDDFTAFFRLWKTITNSKAKIINLRQLFVAMNIMNKCAKFHKDSPSDKKVKFNLPSAIELSETADFVVQLCIETLCKWATSVAHLTNFSFECFSPLHPYTHRTQRFGLGALVWQFWVPWCDSRNRASRYQIKVASWQRRADRMRAE